MKRCARCELHKTPEAFYADKSKASGLSSYCKRCRIKTSCLRQVAGAEKYREYMRDYYKKNAPRFTARNRAHYEANREAVAKSTDAWRRANLTKSNGYSRRYREANPSKRAALYAKYRAALIQRTPAWLNQADLAEIDGIYHFANLMQQITGVEYHVDHIEPLQGLNVSGLHVPWNLRAIPAQENVAKGNRRI